MPMDPSLLGHAVVGSVAFAAQAPTGGAAGGGFWAEYGDKILVAIVTAVLVLLARKPVEALLAKLGQWLEHRFAGLGLRFTKRYLEALAETHRWLKLRGRPDVDTWTGGARRRGPCRAGR
jgi:hypothetical protein